MSGKAVDPNLDPCQKLKEKRRHFHVFKSCMISLEGSTLLWKAIYEGLRIKLRAFCRFTKKFELF
jgi:hypothetical protein